ncbi:hypothetical protein EZ428_18495 [Pedobacter frigiditerrae]|uniref:Alginate lyase domain-containing protein n=1 Tax=Pedobacter frigiditerrae TaxID=2530452 RepID=A0A4R0MP77_9SPHI|nr:alginate lyase family protein [Pedobacter frigiditerrae]TCC88628.1 hypothetical protein EZ428_18495 [Pedobacter frigiditerrae]
MTRNFYLSLFICSLFLIQQATAQQKFVHPGILHGNAALDLIHQRVNGAKQPWLGGVEALRANPFSSSAYKVKGGFDSVAREKDFGLHAQEVNNDCIAAYYNALMWTATGKKAHAEKAVEILNAYSYKLKAIVRRDKELLAGLNGSHFLNAAEIIRYSYKGWDPKDIAQCEKMFLEVFYPVVKSYAPWANGNWGNACLKTAMAIGVFCNNREIFDDAVNYYLKGEGNASLPNYIYESGQCQESGRDQAHAQLGLGNLAECAEIAYNQGIDLYGALNNRLLKGFEYTAKYNLGGEVPFEVKSDVTKKYMHQTVSADNRGEFRPIYEMVYNHYQNRKGINAPYTKKVIDKIRPEGAGPRPYDQPGFGTLTFSLKKSE